VIRLSVIALTLTLACAAAVATKAVGQPLPQWIPVGTLDKPFNEAAVDHQRRQRFALQDCGNSSIYFICTYAANTGIGLVAWAKQPVGLVDQINIAIPVCNAMSDLDDIATMLIYIFHPKRPAITFHRSIVAMANFAANKGNGEQWLDGINYQLIDRKELGFGLVVRRTPPNMAPPSEQDRARSARAQRFYMPASDCPIPTGTIAVQPVQPAAPSGDWRVTK